MSWVPSPNCLFLIFAVLQPPTVALPARLVPALLQLKGKMRMVKRKFWLLQCYLAIAAHAALVVVVRTVARTVVIAVTAKVLLFSHPSRR